MSEKIIQLRRGEASNKNTPSDYEVTLKYPLTLSPGKTEISIKNIFIDSVQASEGKIVLDKDTEISISALPYITNWTSSGKNYNDAGVGSSDPTQPDGKKYFPCNKSPAVDLSNISMLGGITLYKEDVGNFPWGSISNNLQVYIDFTDITGQKSRVQVPIPKFNTKGGDPKYNVNQFLFNSSTNSNLFPIYFEGTPAQIREKIKISFSKPLTTEDNINTDSAYSGNTGSAPPVYNNVYLGSDFYTLESIQYAASIDDQVADFGNFNLTGTYVNWRTGLNDNFSFTLDKLSNNNQTTNIANNVGKERGFGIPAVFGTISKQKPSDDDIFNKYNTQKPIKLTLTGTGITNMVNLNPPARPNQTQFEQATFTNTFVMKTKDNTIKFTIPQGSYELNEICQIISDKCVDVNQLSSDNRVFPVHNIFLTTDRQLRVTNDLTPTDTQYYIAEDGNSYFSYDQTGANVVPDKWIGSDQFALVGDELLNKSKISTMHSNLYNNGAVETKFIKNGTQAGASYSLVGENGGVVLTDLSPQGFWEQLGWSFEENKNICPTAVHKHVIINNLPYLTQSMPTTRGRYTTSSLTGMDNAIIKSSFTDFGGMDSLLGGSITSTNTEIISTNALAEGQDNDGYFLIEITGIGMNQELVGDNYVSNTIQAIISRYYSTSSFTSAYNEGSIPFVYQGVGEQTISKFRIRILDPDGQPSQNLGENSAVFLSLMEN